MNIEGYVAEVIRQFFEIKQLNHHNGLNWRFTGLEEHEDKICCVFEEKCYINPSYVYVWLHPTKNVIMPYFPII